ncbi:MAG: hypothetical protein AB1505_24585 [Candidatus Latescibacterota bacterium]
MTPARAFRSVPRTPAAAPDPVNPRFPDRHGPQLDTEWWQSREGLRWSRPFRDLNATPDGVRIISHNPMAIGGRLLFHFGNQLLGLPEDRITYLAARANVEFSTHPFTVPPGRLVLNAAIPAPDRAFAADQAYVMVAVLDAQGRQLEGYERERCILRNADALDLPLEWAGRDTRGLAGRRAQLRFYARAARIYAVREAARVQEAGPAP